MDKKANRKDNAVKTTGKRALPAIEKSPTFAWVRKKSKNEVTIVVFEDFFIIPINNAMKLMLTITPDFNINWR